MSTNSRIGYLENGMVMSIYCHWDGYPAWNGAVLQECYCDSKKAKELVDREGYISSLGSRIHNTRFVDNPETNEVRLDSLEDFLNEDYLFHYWMDGDGQWRVHYMGREALLADVLDNPALFAKWEPSTKDGAIERLCQLREKLRNCYQSWYVEEDNEDVCVESWYVPEGKHIVLVNGYTGVKWGEIACDSLEMAEKVSREIFGWSFDDIMEEFRPKLDFVVKEAEDKASVERQAGVEREMALD